jgi:hypothetical protein
VATKDRIQSRAGESLGHEARSYEAPAIVALGTLAELTEGTDYTLTNDPGGYYGSEVTAY